MVVEKPYQQSRLNIFLIIVMRNHKFFRSLLVCVLFVGVLAGCQREMIEEEIDVNSILLSKVESNTQMYISSLEPSTLKKGKWWKILGADLKGALSGAATGAAIGSAAPGVGTGGGAIVGAVLGGAGASFEAAAGLADPGVTPPTSNPNNPYDPAGALHYSLLDVMIAFPGEFIQIGGFNYSTYRNFILNRLVNNGLLSANNIADFPLATFAAEQASFLGNGSPIAFVNQSNNPNLLPIEKSVSIQYFQAMSSSQSVSAFTNFSIGIENTVAASGIADRSKAVLLSEMATARYGFAYWYQ